MRLAVKPVGLEGREREREAGDADLGGISPCWVFKAVRLQETTEGRSGERRVKPKPWGTPTFRDKPAKET